MLDKLDIEIDKKCVENYLLYLNLRPLFPPLLIAVFILTGQILGTFDGMNIDVSRFNKYISFLFVISIGTYLFTLLQAKMLKYEIKENALHMESGVFYQTAVSVPLDQITDVEIYSGIFEKLLGMELLKVQTAGRGSNNPEITIIAPSTPKDVRSKLMLKNVSA